MERGTGFSELIDPVIQRERLIAQSLAAAAGDPEAMQLDEDFLAALEFGAPPMGGLGLGIDRLVMLFTDAGIRETILFPLLKPGSLVGRGDRRVRTGRIRSELFDRARAGEAERLGAYVTPGSRST